MAPGNPTGFDPQRFAAAAGQPAKDPWARYEAWRFTGPFSRRSRFRGIFPGFGIAAVAFAAYCGYEYVFLKDDHHGHGSSGHGEEKH